MPTAVDEVLEPLRADYRRGVLIETGVRAALVAGLTVVLVWIALPSWLVVASIAAVTFVLASLGLRAVRLPLDVAAVDRKLRLDERLRTWDDLCARRDRPESLPWLERELVARLRDVPLAARRRVGRRGLGPWSILLWAIVVLLLLRALLPALPEGALELAGTGAEGRSGAAPNPGPADGTPGGSGAGPAPAAGADAPGTAEPDPDPAPPDDAVEPPPPEAGAQVPDQPPPDQPPPGEESVAELPPEAVVDRPTEELFAVPQFIGDEAGEVREAPVVGLEEVAPSGAPPTGPAPAPERGGAASADGGDEPRTPPVDWERALERALRSRHVPEVERPFVREFFRSLAGSRAEERDR